MSDAVPLILACAAGVGLGLFYFSGLWLTMRYLPTARWPALLMLGSLIVRMAVLLVGFFYVMADRWERMLACLIGFVLMRFVVLSWSQPGQEPPPPQPEKETE